MDYKYNVHLGCCQVTTKHHYIIYFSLSFLDLKWTSECCTGCSLTGLFLKTNNGWRTPEQLFSFFCESTHPKLADFPHSVAAGNFFCQTISHICAQKAKWIKLKLWLQLWMIFHCYVRSDVKVGRVFHRKWNTLQNVGTRCDFLWIMLFCFPSHLPRCLAPTAFPLTGLFTAYLLHSPSHPCFSAG